MIYSQTPISLHCSIIFITSGKVVYQKKKTGYESILAWSHHALQSTLLAPAGTCTHKHSIPHPMLILLPTVEHRFSSE